MPRVLIVDDEPDNLYLLSALLRGHGWEVTEARHGAEALGLARKTPPDLAVTDLLMPVMDGYTLLRQWKADPELKAVPLVVYTATYTDTDDEKLALDLGADAFILKPAEPDVFLAELDRILSQVAQGQVPAAAPAVTEEPVVLRQYSEALVRRLEDKSRLLELANRDLRAREAHLRAVLDTEPACVKQLDSEGRFLDVNASGLRMLGVGRCDEIAGQSFLPLVVEEDRAAVRDLVARVFRGERGSLEYRCTPPTGGCLWMATDAVPLRGPTGEITAMLGITRDITARREAEAAFRNLGHAIDAAGDVVITTDLDGIFTSVNAEFTKLYGFTAEEVVGKVTPRILKSGKHPRAFYQHTWARWQSGETVRSEIVNKTKDGRLVDIENTAGPFRDARGELAGFMEIQRDISARRRAEAEAHLLQEVALGVAGARTLDEALGFVLRQVCEATGWAMGEVWVPDREGVWLECHPVWHGAAPGLAAFRQSSESHRFAAGDGLPGRVWQTKRPEWATALNDRSRLPRSEAANRAGLTAGLGVPVLAHGEVVLVLEFFLFARGADDARRIDLIASLGAQIGTLIERQQAIQALRESEGKFRTLFENSMDGLLLTMPDGAVLAANPAACRLIGRSETEICRLGRRGLVDENDPRLGALLEERSRTGSVRGEINLIRGDGSLVDVELSSAVYSTPDGVRTSLIIHDITERKRAAAALREAERFAVSALEALSAHLAILDAEGRILMVNDRWRKFAEDNAPVTGSVCEGASYLGVCDAATGADAEVATAFATGVRDVIAGRRTEFELDYPCHSPSERRWFTGRVTRFAGAGPVRVVVAHENITGRTLAEEEMAASEAHFRGLIENASDLVTELDAEGVIRMQGPSVERLLGYRPDEFVGRSALTWIHAEDVSRVAAAIQHALAEPQQSVVVEYRFRHKDGSWRTLESIGRTAPTAGSGIVVNSRDVTDQRRLEERLSQTQKLEAIGQLAGGVAHDFNNILAAVTLQAEWIASIDGLPAAAKEGLAEMRTAAERAARLTRQLLLFSRRQVIQPRDLDLNEVITGLAGMLQRIVGEDVRMRLDLCTGALMVRVDPSMLDQVLLNLIVNARDAMPAGGQLLVATSEKNLTDSDADAMTGTVPGRYALLRVTDTGSGIAPEVVSRIFEPFFTTKAPGKGTGLGLSTVFGIVKQHRGAINVQSEAGRGTTFEILLPLADASRHEPTPAPDAVPESATSKPGPRGGTETILVVEDESSVRSLTRMALERAGYRVLEAAHGIEALRRWKDNAGAIHLLLTDIVMPEGLDGRQLAERLREDNPDLRVIFTSGFSASIAGQELVLRPGDTFLQKPVSVVDLLEAVRRTLDSRS